MYCIYIIFIYIYIYIHIYIGFVFLAEKCKTCKQGKSSMLYQ